MNWKIDLERWSFDDPNYYVSLFLTCTVSLYVLIRIWVYSLEVEHANIEKEIVKMTAEEVVFDQRTATEGKPPFFSWESSTAVK